MWNTFYTYLLLYAIFFLFFIFDFRFQCLGVNCRADVSDAFYEGNLHHHHLHHHHHHNILIIIIIVNIMIINYAYCWVRPFPSRSIFQGLFPFIWMARESIVTIYFYLIFLQCAKLGCSSLVSSCSLEMAFYQKNLIRQVLQKCFSYKYLHNQLLSATSLA